MLDLRLTNATFLTMDDAHPVAAQLGIWQGRIVGLDDEVASLPAAAEIDLDGAVVLPGFIDAHVHLFWAGLAALSPSIAAATSIDEALELIAAAVERAPVGDWWLDVVGYDQRRLGRHLRASDLDAVSAGRKLFVIHDSGHACAVNTDVLKLLPPTVPHQDGVLTESGMAAVRSLRMPYEVDQLEDALELAGRTCRAQGVTAVAEAGIGGGLVRHSPVELAAFQNALEAGRLPVRVQAMVAADALRPVTVDNDGATYRALNLGLRTGLGDDRLSIGALKIFTDGGMMARTAALTSPYVGSDGSGELYTELDEIHLQITEGNWAGWQLAIHAIGDRAVDVALDALQIARDEWNRPQARHRIEHAGLVRPDQLARFAELDVTDVVQPGFLRWFGDDYAAIMGPERASWLYRGRSFLDAGVRLVASSDRPVTTGAPLEAIQFMVERTSRGGQVIGPDETIGVDAALRAHTIEAAHACGWETALGSLTAGKYADLVVLAADPRHVPPSEIAAIQVLTTYLNGVNSP